MSGPPAPPRRIFLSCGCDWETGFTCPRCSRGISDLEDRRADPDPDLEYEFERDGKEWL